ncbi:MAG TPA: 3-dehydroquinate synthase [Polyangiaceae bacterium]|nr:3-dehydroquinate synthase [Polyangiaceae bacterium]
MRSIVLSGFMGSGKSTVGPLVAARLGLPFVDTDEEVERATGERIADLWRREGESAFRQREAALAQALLEDSRPKVIAFGGGTVTMPHVRRLAIDRALVVTLTGSPEALAARAGTGVTRPLLASPGDDPVARVRELLAQRRDAYGECHLTVATDALDVDAVATAVVALSRRNPLLVPLGSRSYAIDVCSDEPPRLTDAIARCAPSSIVLVTDSHVQRARGGAIERAIGGVDVPITRVTLPPGEENKTLATVSAIWDAALGARVDRDALLLAVGGGVVGDLAGFAAACTLRGIRFVQVPTTLLAMVDSSVGGKTGIDHPTGKNLVGAFHQPSAVVADLDHLSTLDGRQFAAGLAEVVKIALVADEGLLEDLESAAAAVIGRDRVALARIVRAAIDAKIRIVRDDERESGVRALLNLGHTIGHALEARGGYSRWLHGEAVALGTIVELRATAVLGWTPRALVHRAERLFSTVGLATHVDEADLAAAWPFVDRDKKRDQGALRLPVVMAAGRAVVERVTPADLRAAVLNSDPQRPA